MSRFPGARFLLSAAAPAQFPADVGREVAFAGRSNTGKSSAINAITQRHGLARTSKTPGRTRLLNFFELAPAKRLVDLPGYGYAAGPRSEKESWRGMIERFLTRREELRALVVLVDGDLGPQESDAEMIAWAQTLPVRLIVVATKLDKLARTRRRQRLEKIAGQLHMPLADVLGFSAKEHYGTEELWRAVVNAAEAKA
jgi:GTP-binding protein